MRRFRFRLAPVLRLRAQIERGARRELGRVMAAVDAVAQRLQAAERGIADCGAQASSGDAVGRLARALEDGLRRHRWRLQQELRQAEAQLDVVRTDYAQKARDLKAIQQLRDKQRDLWRRAALAAEQAELDELAQLQRATRGDDESSGGLAS